MDLTNLIARLSTQFCKPLDPFQVTRSRRANGITVGNLIGFVLVAERVVNVSLRIPWGVVHGYSFPMSDYERGLGYESLWRDLRSRHSKDVSKLVGLGREVSQRKDQT
jgi:hypothetical protein